MIACTGKHTYSLHSLSIGRPTLDYCHAILTMQTKVKN